MTSQALRSYQRQDAFESIMEGLAADGGVIIPDFVDRKFIDLLNAQLHANVEETAPGTTQGDLERRRFWGGRTKRLSRLAARAPAFAELLDDDFLHRWAEHTLAADYWLNTGQAMIVGPGEQAQVLHRDIGIWPYIQQMGTAAPEAMVSIILALSDFTEEVGATRVVPGSHRAPDFTTISPLEASVPAVMPAGGALLYLGKTVHGAGANRTADSWRHGLHLSFVLGWLTPEEASPIGVPWDVARSFSPRVQRMLGFASPGPGAQAPPRNWLIDFVDVRSYLGSSEP